MDIEVIKEMVRLAEQRRAEELHRMEKLNNYNLALIAFSGSFLSLLVTANFALTVLRIGGFILLLSILSSLFAIRPRIIRGGSIVIDEDVQSLRAGSAILLATALFSTYILIAYATL